MFSRMVASQVKHNSYFLCGLVIGLWLALVAVPLEDEMLETACDVTNAAQDLQQDEMATEEALKKLEAPGSAGGAGPVRALQRPRYYTTELGIRAPLLVAILTSEEQLEHRVPALNVTLSSLGGAVRWFLSARGAVPPRAGLVAFTDTREMLRPFHVIKYLADNHLEDYDFFFLCPDSSLVNARALSALARALSVSQHVYMGATDPDSQYLSLDGGILVSNSVLRAVHGSLDWCVRNSYSARHHENLGRCVLHAARHRARTTHKGVQYTSVPYSMGWNASDAITVTGVHTPEQIHLLHAHIARMSLSRVQSQVELLSEEIGGRARWPRGRRTELGLAPDPPDNRFDVFRWSLSNGSHWLFPDDDRSIAKLPNVYKKALDAVVSRALSWVSSRRSGEFSLREAAWLWTPSTDLTYRLLLTRETDQKKSLVGVEVVRAVGAARLVPVPYVTESARVTVLSVLRGGALPHCRQGHRNTRTLMVALYKNETDLQTNFPALQSTFMSQPAACREGAELVSGVGGAGGGACGGAGPALRAARGEGGLMLYAGGDVDYSDEFLNRVRMNCVPGVSWFLPVARARPVLQRPGAAGAARFNDRHHDVYAFYYKDYDQAMAGAPPDLCPLDALLGSPLRLILGPEPELWRAPSPPAGPPPGPPAGPPAGPPGAPLPPPSPALALGSRSALAAELLQREAGVSPD